MRTTSYDPTLFPPVPLRWALILVSVGTGDTPPTPPTNRVYPFALAKITDGVVEDRRPGDGCGFTVLSGVFGHWAPLRRWQFGGGQDP